MALPTGTHDGTRSAGSVRLLHTSDLHIGDRHGEDDPRRSLPAIMDTAVERNVDLVIIAGDLFDHNRVGQPLVDAVRDELGRIGIPVVLLPGNHDPLEGDSVYWRMELPPTVRVLRDPEGEAVAYAHLGLSVWGRPHTSYHDDLQPLANIPPRGDATWEVAVAHGHWVTDPSNRSYLITPGEIALTLRDYVALGHWDIDADVSAEGVTARYSGSPHRHGSSVMIVSLELCDGKRRVHVEPVTIA